MTAHGHGERGWIDAALEEYKAHRAEVLANQQSQHQSLGLGVTAIGILAAGAFNVWGDDRFVATVVFMAGIPSLTLVVLVVWAGSVLGMMRVGAYLEELETTLRGAYANVPDSVLIWETTLVAPHGGGRAWRPYDYWHELGAIAVLALLALGSVGLGAYKGWADHEASVGIAAAVAAGVVLTATTGVAVAVGTARDRARKKLPGTPGNRPGADA